MKKIIASLTALAVMLFVAAPYADAAVRMIACSNVGNGARSRNTAICIVGVQQGEDGEPSIVQKNRFSSVNMIMVAANTGENKSNYNTGNDGDVNVTSGDAKVKINIFTTANSNVVDD
ncbi:MAG: hypothetical protein FJ044_02200 [Candidatus Cloacimonetes bacterium]|nr:hypothetical protein [Candidatus Cloacimonadota bacterium]